MNELDYIIIGVIAISSLISVVRGFLKEAFSLGVWVLASTLTFMFAHRFSVFMPGFVENSLIRLIATAVVIFLFVLFSGAIVNHFIYKAAAKVGLSGTDRLLGVLFGVARGVIILIVLVMLAQLMSLPQTDLWQASLLVDYLVFAVTWLQSHLAL